MAGSRPTFAKGSPARPRWWVRKPSAQPSSWPDRNDLICRVASSGARPTSQFGRWGSPEARPTLRNIDHFGFFDGENGDSLGNNRPSWYPSPIDWVRFSRVVSGRDWVAMKIALSRGGRAYYNLKRSKDILRSPVPGPRRGRSQPNARIHFHGGVVRQSVMTARLGEGLGEAVGFVFPGARRVIGFVLAIVAPPRGIGTNT